MRASRTRSLAANEPAKACNRVRIFIACPVPSKQKGIWSVSVSGNWRVTFRFAGRDVEIVNYEDYH
ncbi:MAG: hypothetical protein GQ538_04400 [Xanthomonadales bacterium]|nr:hypothetical protein [Xanthomonadales bacterium]